MMISRTSRGSDSYSREGSTFSAPGSIYSSIREIPSKVSAFARGDAAKTSLKVAAAVSLVLPAALGFMSGSSEEEIFFPNATHFNQREVSHPIVWPFLLRAINNLCAQYGARNIRVVICSKYLAFRWGWEFIRFVYPLDNQKQR